MMISAHAWCAPLPHAGRNPPRDPSRLTFAHCEVNNEVAVMAIVSWELSWSHTRRSSHCPDFNIVLAGSGISRRTQPGTSSRTGCGICSMSSSLQMLPSALGEHSTRSPLQESARLIPIRRRYRHHYPIPNKENKATCRGQELIIPIETPSDKVAEAK